MATQESFNNAVTLLSTTLAKMGKKVSPDCKVYWEGVLDKAAGKTFKGTVQNTVSNPSAYFLVPLSGEGKSGRGHELPMSQFIYALKKGWTSKTHEYCRALKGLTAEEIAELLAEGLYYSQARKDSALGNKQERLEQAKVSTTNRLALVESTQARLLAKREEQAAKKAAGKGKTPQVQDEGNQDTGLV